MSPDHHLRRSHHFLHLAAADLDAGNYRRAAGALARSASHVVTAAAVHWHYPHNTRRRLHMVLSMLMFNGLLEYRHHRTFRHVCELSDILAGSSVPDGRRRLRRARRRVSRLIAAVTAAMDADPNPRTWQEFIADDELTGPPCDRPSRYEMHTTIPARCNNLSFPPGNPQRGSVVYDPDGCPKCAAFSALIASRR